MTGAVHIKNTFACSQLGGTKVFEGTAICLYLADKLPEANLAPRIGSKERGRYAYVDRLLGRPKGMKMGG